MGTTQVRSTYGEYGVAIMHSVRSMSLMIRFDIYIFHGARNTRKGRGEKEKKNPSSISNDLMKQYEVNKFFICVSRRLWRFTEKIMHPVCMYIPLTDQPFAADLVSPSFFSLARADLGPIGWLFKSRNFLSARNNAQFFILDEALIIRGTLRKKYKKWFGIEICGRVAAGLSRECMYRWGSDLMNVYVGMYVHRSHSS